MNAALHRGWRKAARTLIQLAVGGALTAAVDVLASGLAPNTKVLVMTGWTALIALLQNTLETGGKIPVLLPTPGLVPSVGPVSKNVGVVDTAVDTAGDLVGDVTGTVTDVIGGGLLGEVVPPGEEDEA